MHMHGGASEKTKRILRISLLATLAYVALTFVAGVRAHSLALISEAGHNVSDFLALLLSFVAVYFQTRPPTDQKTFGYQRAGVLAAFLNALTLVLIAIWIAIAAIHRLSEPVQVQPRLMMIVAAAGVLMNGVIAALLWTTSRDVNIRSTFIHMLGDTLSTAAVIVGGAAILDRPGAFHLHRRADFVEFAVHCAGDAQHPAGGYAPRMLIGGDTGFASGYRRGPGCARPARVESGFTDSRPGHAHYHCRHPAIRERPYSGAGQRDATAEVPHLPLHHPIRVCRM
jgi:hypothetical protein